MKLICSHQALLNSITIVSKAVSNRTTLPILECILLKADDKGFCLTSNDLEFAIQSAPIEATIEEKGSIALEAKLFSEIIRKIIGDIISISTNEKGMAIISCGNSEFKIIGQPSEEFPEIPIIEKNTEYCILQNKLKNSIRQTIFSIAQEESKPILTGELIEIDDNEIHIVSVDGYRISYRKQQLLKSGNKITAVVPGKTLNEISKILSNTEEEIVSLFFTDKHILFYINENIVVSRLIEGEYIKYAQSFTEDFKTKIYINRLLFMQALERASLICRDSKKVPVKIEITQSELIITSNTDINTAYEEVSADIEGDILKIAFNPRYLIDALKVIEEERICIQFTTSLSPCIIKPIEGNNYKYLILPLRM